MAFIRATVVSAACLSVCVDANAFLGMHPNHNDRQVLVQEVEGVLSHELASEKTSRDIKQIEEALGPLYATLPKNEQGRLEPAVVRYALHRYFSQRYGWHLNGLAQQGESWNATSPTEIMNGQVPSYIESLIEKRLGHGLGLEELAVFAATMYDLIYKEILHDLEHVYEVAGVATTSLASSEDFDKVVRMTLVARIDGVEQGGNSLADYAKSERLLEENFWAWKGVVMWADDFHKTYDTFHQSRNPFKEGYEFDYALRFMEELSVKYGHLQTMDCRVHKTQLMDLELQGTGRVPLRKFYSGMGDEDWPFVEKESYLRNLGALDETDPNRPAVIIPNYLNGLSNCLSPSAFYSVCCVNECEGLLSHVEKAIAAPEGEPARIIEVVSSLGSDTVDAPRNLSASQARLLSEIAEHHGGRVPLHGRLFAQWMHHAFPRECDFPHVSGTTNPEIADDWQDRTGSDIYAGDHEIRKYMIASDPPSKALAEPADSLPWTAIEELVGSHKLAPPSPGDSQTSKPIRAMMLLLAVASAFWPMVRASKAASEKMNNVHYV